jgi:hypothetical protein
MGSMRIAVLCIFVLTLAAPSHAQAQLAVSMHGGLVTISASNVTVRQILAEWAKVGQTRIVNGEGVPGGPLTLQLTNVPEEQALDILLRSAAGYVAAPRAVADANASHFDRIIVMPTSAPSAPRAITSAPTRVPQRIDTTPFDQDDDRNPPPAPPLQTLQDRLQQAQQQLQPGQRPAPSNATDVNGSAPPAPPVAAAPPPALFAVPTPAVPGGVSTPGVVVPAPRPGQLPPGASQDR